MEIPPRILSERVAKDEHGQETTQTDRRASGVFLVGPVGFVVLRRVQTGRGAGESAGQRLDVLIDDESVELVEETRRRTFGFRVAIDSSALKRRVIVAFHPVDHRVQNALVMQPVEFDQMRVEEQFDDLFVVALVVTRRHAGENQRRRNEQMLIVGHVQDFVDEFFPLDQRQRTQFQFIGIGNIVVVRRRRRRHRAR